MNVDFERPPKLGALVCPVCGRRTPNAVTYVVLCSQCMEDADDYLFSFGLDRRSANAGRYMQWVRRNQHYTRTGARV